MKTNEYEQALMAAYNSHAKANNQLPALCVEHVPAWYNDAFLSGMQYGMKEQALAELYNNCSYNDPFPSNKGVSSTETTQSLQSDHFRDSAKKTQNDLAKMIDRDTKYAVTAIIIGVVAILSNFVWAYLRANHIA